MLRHLIITITNLSARKSTKNPIKHGRPSQGRPSQGRLARGYKTLRHDCLLNPESAASRVIINSWLSAYQDTSLLKSGLVRHYLTDEARRGFIIEYQSQQSLPDWSDDTVIPEVPQDSDNLVETWQTARCLLQFSPCFHCPHARICSNRLNKSTPKQWPRRGAIVFCMENLFMAQTRLIVFTENEP